MRSARNTTLIRILGGKPERKRPLRRSRQIAEDNIKMNLRQRMGCELDSSGTR
jgi:hypothetical protein